MVTQGAEYMDSQATISFRCGYRLGGGDELNAHWIDKDRTRDSGARVHVGCVDAVSFL